MGSNKFILNKHTIWMIDFNHISNKAILENCDILTRVREYLVYRLRTLKHTFINDTFSLIKNLNAIFKVCEFAFMDVSVSSVGEIDTKSDILEHTRHNFTKCILTQLDRAALKQTKVDLC